MPKSRNYKKVKKALRQEAERQAARKQRFENAEPQRASFDQAEHRGGLLVTEELKKAREECESRVAEIVEECIKNNRKFRDIEFDLEHDKERCLHGPAKLDVEPSDVRRVTQIFDKPEFFVDGASSNDIIQGKLGDCWFLSALATMATRDDLVENLCVKRDERIGVYGFIFFRDMSWTVVIIDDLLYTAIPKFEELNQGQKDVHHNNKEKFNQSARKGSGSLLFARSGTDNETWVPLIEKAYAKLHGSYSALQGGEEGEAIEDLTGGVTTVIYTKDILDPEDFWTKELLNHDAHSLRLFGCAFDKLRLNGSTAYDQEAPKVNGLFGDHAYSVLRAVNIEGKRFLVIRNPWGNSEWTGRWSDGSQEWTEGEGWLPVPQGLKHKFGNDGQFVMEYEDFLENWDEINQTLLFDDTWVMSSHWLKVTAQLSSAWRYGDVSFTFSVPQKTSAVIVLSKLDDRGFQVISNSAAWGSDFVLYKKDGTKPIATSSLSPKFARSVNVNYDLDPGVYIVHVRLDKPDYTVAPEQDEDDQVPDDSPTYSSRIVSRARTEKAISESIASNFDRGEHAQYLPIPLSALAGQDISELEAKAKAAAEALKREQQALKNPESQTASGSEPHNKDQPGDEAVSRGGKQAIPGDEDGGSNDDTDREDGSNTGEDKQKSARVYEEDDDYGEIYLGLRVYTKKGSEASISGHLRHEMVTSFDGFAIGRH